jgi:hypothetical protein
MLRPAGSAAALGYLFFGMRSGRDGTQRGLLDQVQDSHAVHEYDAPAEPAADGGPADP